MSFYTQHIAWGLAAVATGVMWLAVLLVYRCWSRGQSRLRLPGWLLVVASFWLWTLAAGPEVGLAMGATVLTLSAIAWIGWRGQWRTGSSPHSRRTGRETLAADTSESAQRPWLRGTARVLLAGPLAFTASLGLAMTVMAFSGGMSEANRLVTGAFVVLLFWCGAMAWSCAVHRLRGPSLALGALCLVSSLLLAVAT